MQIMLASRQAQAIVDFDWNRYIIELYMQLTTVLLLIMGTSLLSVTIQNIF